MRFLRPRHHATKGIWAPSSLVTALVCLLGLAGAGLFVFRHQIFSRHHRAALTLDSNTRFTLDFPTDEKLRQELHQLRMQARLTPENEQAILGGVTRAATVMDIPPAVLWCLLFQESRLNHLAGEGESAGAVGLGQFSKFSFYEVNHHLTKFSDSNLSAFYKEMGKDVRPIHRLRKNESDQSSYYYIPTAVVASAAYLNNRRHHLRTLLTQHQIAFDNDLLWLYATLAYNKGTRSVLAFWNVLQEDKGAATLQASLHDVNTLTGLVQNPKLVRKAFGRIWPAWQAKSYANEWLIHFRNTSVCALKNEPAPITRKGS